MSRNQITSIKTTIFRGLNNLQKLYLSLNQIDSIDSQSFKDLENLIFDLSSNQIASIDAQTFNGLKKLEVLKLEKKRIR